MKTLFLSFLLFLSTLTNAQTFSEVIIDSNLTKETLYSNALSFFAATFNSANAVIQMKDPESGKVIGKGIIDGKEVMITITCKDKKYKYDIEMPMTKEINLPITKLGNLGYVGVTNAPVEVIDGKNVVIKDRVYFKHNSYPNVYIYNSELPGHSPAALTGKYYQAWKEMVDEELAKPQYQNLNSVDDPNLTYLKAKIKSEMSKSDF
jgi:hypothetical protein